MYRRESSRLHIELPFISVLNRTSNISRMLAINRAILGAKAHPSILQIATILTRSLGTIHLPSSFSGGLGKGLHRHPTMDHFAPLPLNIFKCKNMSTFTPTGEIAGIYKINNSRILHLRTKLP